MDSIAGFAPPVIDGVGARSRLFVSPVKPVIKQVGAALLPLSTDVRTASVVPAPKTAWEPPPSPTTVNSTVVQFGDRFSMLSGLLTDAARPPSDSDTASLPPVAMPLKTALARFAAVSGPPVSVVAGEFVKQSPLNVAHPVGQVVL